MVLAQAHAIGVAGVDERIDELDAAVLRGEDRIADPVDADERPALGYRDELAGVVGVVLVADEAAAEVDALLGEHVLLHVAADRVLTVGDARQPRRDRCHARSGDHLAIVFADGVEGGDLDHPRFDARVADAVLDLVQVELGDLLRRAHAPVPRDADLLVVEARGAHDLHAGPLRDFGEELRVATEVDRARVDERAHAVVAQLFHALDGTVDARGAVP